MSITNFAEAAILNAAFNNTSFVVVNTFIKLHTGDPGEDSLNNASATTTRVAASWSVAAGGSLSNDIAITFSPLAATETISFVSVWDALTGGNSIWNGPLGTPQNVNAGGTLTFIIGSITVTLN